ncbi:MAG: glutamine synthetase [Bacteroidales bacterium]|nr:glutamine synthetase [Bacteroidales bacterium]
MGFYNKNKLVQYLQKPAEEFSKEDIIKYIKEHQIEMLNFRYVAEDGKLKTLNFVFSDYQHLDQILSTGERVDGSSLFSFMDSGSSDLYVIPRYKTAFLNPFSEQQALDMLCSFYDHKGEPLAIAPEYILQKAHRQFKKSTGFSFKALGELEYYVMADKEDLYPATDQKGYHTSAPFTNWEHLRTEAIRLISECGGRVKYGHSEVGNFTTENEFFEQHEIEFLPVNVEDTADQLVIAKWILRMLGQKYGVRISFAPKISVGKAGSGLHIHMMLEKDGENKMVENDILSITAKKMIAGLLHMAGALTAFGNTIPTSYLRLVPHQEAPTNICWGDRNRSVLVRVPLGWLGAGNMINHANPNALQKTPNAASKQTVEFRAGDGSADIYEFLAGLIIAAEYGILQPDSLEKAESLYVDVNIFEKEHMAKAEKLASLPTSCWESADCLQKQRKLFEANGIFPANKIDHAISKLKSYEDEYLSEELYGNVDAIKELVEKHLHCK